MYSATVEPLYLQDLCDSYTVHSLLEAPARISSDGDICFIIDLGGENVGFIDFDIEVPHDCRIDIGWGEHIIDGRCRTDIKGRSFGVTVFAKAGRCRYMNPFRRFACRYIQFFVHAHEAKINYAGLRPTYYPLKAKEFHSGNLLRDTIYKVSADTLRMCMHEHYEDGPWREQALYTLDSRNQMLCGYYAFEEYRFARASLELLGRSIRNDGLIPICAPSDTNIYIPSYSTAYFLQMNEYIKYSKDTTLAEELYGTLEKILSAFTDCMDEKGLVPQFAGDRAWNYYEWMPALDGMPMGVSSGRDAPLNLWLILAFRNMAEICLALKKTERADELEACADKLCLSVIDEFWDKDEKLFSIYHGDKKFSVLVNALALLAGAARGLDRSEMEKLLVRNGKTDENTDAPGRIPCSISSQCFRFDALLQIDRDRYRELVLNEIDARI